MQVILAAAGADNHTITEDCRRALQNAGYIIGARRLLDNLPDGCTQNRVAATRPDDIMQLLHTSETENNVVLYSGDTGFYSGARLLIPLLEAEGIAYEVLPGISSVQLLSSAIGRPWQDWLLVSAHGVDCDPVGAVMQGKTVFFLTGGNLRPEVLCQQLTDAGLGELPVTIGEDLSYPGQRIRKGTAAGFCKETFSPLSVLLAEPAPGIKRRTPGFPDSVFMRGEVPMTKQEVRAAILAKLAPKETDILWDIGAGTGSVSIELALSATRGRTYAVECNKTACELIRANRQKLGAWNLRLIEGHAPEVLDGLETPDGVFIGGSKGSMQQLVDLVLERNPKSRICISAICIETVYQAVQALKVHGIEPDIIQLSVSRSKTAGSLHLMMANNPVFLIAGNCDD